MRMKMKEYAFASSCENGHLEVCKWLYKIKPTIDISADDEYAFRWSCENGHLKVCMWLYEIKNDINFDLIFNELYNTDINQKIIEWLITISDVFTYTKHNNIYKLVKYIKTIKKDIIMNDKCCVCLEESNCMTPCKHEMCLQCINILNDKKCPICRTQFDHCFVKN